MWNDAQNKLFIMETKKVFPWLETEMGPESRLFMLGSGTSYVVSRTWKLRGAFRSLCSSALSSLSPTYVTKERPGANLFPLNKTKQRNMLGWAFQAPKACGQLQTLSIKPSIKTKRGPRWKPLIQIMVLDPSPCFQSCPDGFGLRLYPVFLAVAWRSPEAHEIGSILIGLTIQDGTWQNSSYCHGMSTTLSGRFHKKAAR